MAPYLVYVAIGLMCLRVMLSVLRLFIGKSES